MATDTVALFTDYAASKGWRSAYVTLETKEWQTTAKDLTGGEYLLLIFPFSESAVMSKHGIVEYWKTSTRLWLGRKFDNTSSVGTMSSIDETPEQKDERRMADIRTALKELVKDLFCDGDYEMLSGNMSLEFNVTNENIDVVVLDLTFKE
jgi:hypothetical protein